MKSLVRAVSLASCCLVVGLASSVEAGEVRLVDHQLDLVTAGAPLFTTNSAFSGVQSQINPGLLQPAPPPPPPPPANPPTTNPPPPAPNQIVLNSGGATAAVTIPNAPAGSDVKADLVASSGNGQSFAAASLQGVISDGNFSSGGTSSSIASTF